MKLCIQWLLSLPILRNAVPSITVNTNTDIVFTTPVFNHACSAPITALLLDTDFLLETNKVADTVTLQRMRASVLRLEQLVKATKGTYDETFSILEVINSCALLFSQRAEIYIYVTKDVQSKMFCKGSQFLFSEVLMCLVSNAVESYTAGQKKRISITITQDSDSVTIDISDAGCGMSKVEQWISCIEGVSCKKKSTGIGLPFCIKTIKKYFSGKLLLKSAVNVGTTVSILLPLYSA